ncbi:hypothetical protein HJC99_02440 [Candidatus Saccharibacteria bacterium]|nr:hypothetical protein [Candidatus Saccharibacteria bacterium]
MTVAITVVVAGVAGGELLARVVAVVLAGVVVATLVVMVLTLTLVDVLTGALFSARPATIVVVEVLVAGDGSLLEQPETTTIAAMAPTASTAERMREIIVFAFRTADGG